jgi:Rod binding domain-containing protein
MIPPPSAPGIIPVRLAAPIAASLTAAPRAPATPATPAGGADDARLREAARAFEAMAIGALLAPMFETIDLSKGPFGGGAGEAAWKPILIEQMAKKMTAAGGLGLSRSIHEAMLRMQEERKP